MTRAVVLSTLLMAGALPMAAADFRTPAPAGQDARPAVEVRRLGGNLYLMTGGGGNTTVFVTELGVVVVDTKPSGWGQPILDRIRTITDRPVTTLINTHGHADHVGGNDVFGTAVQIVAHGNTRANMEKMEGFTGRRAGFLPKLMFESRMSLGTGADRIDLYHFGPGHTDGDTWVVFPHLRAVHAGDMFPARELPRVDGQNGGSVLAYPDTLARAVSSLGGVETVITGHGAVMRAADLRQYATFTRDFRDVVMDGFNHGLSVDEVIDRWNARPPYRGYAAADARLVRNNVQLMFGELAE